MHPVIKMEKTGAVSPDSAPQWAALAPFPQGNSVSDCLLWQPQDGRGRSAVTSGMGTLTRQVLRKQILPGQETA